LYRFYTNFRYRRTLRTVYAVLRTPVFRHYCAWYLNYCNWITLYLAISC